MCTGEQLKPYASTIALLLVFVIVPVSVYAEEISTYKLTGTDGYIGLRYRYDELLNQQSLNPATKETRSNFDEEAHIQTQGYIYHPNFLKVDLGAGILFSQEKLQTATGLAKHDDTLYDFNTRLAFLEEKPYPLTLFYDKSHPSVALNVTDVFTQENEKYGMNFSLRKPVSPVLINFESYKQINKGSSFTQVTNDRNFYQNVSAQADLLNGGYVQLSHTDNRQESMSGSKSLPIKPFNVTTKTSDLNSSFVFGDTQNINLNVIASQSVQKQDRELKELRFAPYLNWKHNAQMNSYLRYNLTERKQPTIESNNSSGAFGLSYQWDEDLNANAELHYDKNSTTGLQLSNYGGRGSVSYKHQLGNALMQFNVGLNYDAYDRQAASSVQIADAPYTLSGTTPVLLAHEYINTSTIVVKRADTNEVLTAGVGNDYVIVVIGNQTQIQKINPALPTDLNVLVSYQYNPGGNAAYHSYAQSYQASVEYYKHTTFFINYRDTKQALTSGMPTLPLDSSNTSSYGMRVDYPLPTDMLMTVGGEVLQEKHNENNTSYNKKSADVYLQVGLPLATNLHLNLRRIQTDYIYSAEDVNLTSYSLRLKSNPLNRLSLILQLDDIKDNGGSYPRNSRNIIFTAQWRLRQLQFEAGAKKIYEKQSSLNHERMLINVNLRREF